MSHITKHIHCDICNTLTETRIQDLKISRLGKSHQIENAAVEICPNCGEIYVPAKTAEQFNKLVKKQPVSA